MSHAPFGPRGQAQMVQEMSKIAGDLLPSQNQTIRPLSKNLGHAKTSQ